METEKTWTHKQWDAICPECGERRLLWPNNQDISSLSDPKCQFIHMNGFKDCS